MPDVDVLVRDGELLVETRAAAGERVLGVLQRLGVAVDAPCGGAGTCRKCRVLVSGKQGTEYVLACQTAADDGMEVVVERPRSLSVQMSGGAGCWEADGAQGGCGLSVDIGTTTLVCRLHDLRDGSTAAAAGMGNPQTVYGADCISRISACGAGALRDMADALGGAIVRMAKNLCHEAGIEAADIARAVIAGNTVMEHIAAGLDPTPIGVAPFEPVTRFGLEREYAPFAQAGIASGRALFAPCVAGYVGGDIVCGLVAQRVYEAEAPVLFLDLGTNGEMALVDAGGITCCATAAGPVFEGANIAFGMPAYPGAVAQAGVGPDGGLEFRTIGGAEPVGICGTGLIDLAAVLLKHGVVDETGRMLDADEAQSECAPVFAQRVCEHAGAPAFRVVGNILVTQKDIRNLQLAKAAVCAGIMTLLDARGMQPADASELVVAGGFGEYLDLGNAAAVGLFPGELACRARSVGNTSIEGASALLVNAAARREAQRVADRCAFIELSGDAGFNARYIEHMGFE